MKQFALSLLLVCPLFLGFFQRSADASTTDYALMPATPYYSEIALARGRLEKFLYKANAKKRAILAQTPIVAVQAAVLQAFGRNTAFKGYRILRAFVFLLFLAQVVLAKQPTPTLPDQAIL